MTKTETKLLKTAVTALFAFAAFSISGSFVPLTSSLAQAEEGDDGRPVINVPRVGGRELFQSCVLCHKYDGRGGPSEGGYGADLRVTTLTHSQLVHVITYGRQARGMPPFKGLLDEDKIETLATFIKEDLRLKE
ncbi:MAG TPA: cytochrome c [Burkholderiales bacterium]|nr:cytochrome c [Burkholderiales bacterium]